MATVSGGRIWTPSEANSTPKRPAKNYSPFRRRVNAILNPILNINTGTGLLFYYVMLMSLLLVSTNMLESKQNTGREIANSLIESGSLTPEIIDKAVISYELGWVDVLSFVLLIISGLVFLIFTAGLFAIRIWDLLKNSTLTALIYIVCLFMLGLAFFYSIQIAGRDSEALGLQSVENAWVQDKYGYQSTEMFDENNRTTKVNDASGETKRVSIALINNEFLLYEDSQHLMEQLETDIKDKDEILKTLLAIIDKGSK